MKRILGYFADAAGLVLMLGFVWMFLLTLWAWTQ